MIFFARYVIERLSRKQISLQDLDSLNHDWRKERPNEANEELCSTEEMLQRDVDLLGEAYYTIENGVKTRIDPRKLVIIRANN